MDNKLPEEIFKAATCGRLVLFIGAGVSRILGCPSWHELAVKLLEKLLEDGQIDFYVYTRLKSLEAKKLLTICEQLYKEKNRKYLFIDVIKSILNGDENKKGKFIQIYQYLYDFNAIYITTNYDTFLDNCVRESGKVIYKKENLLINYLDSGYVIHLHGSINDSRSMVITVSDYLEFYRSNEVRKFLSEVFSNHIVLFVGYGLEEYEILEYLIRSPMNIGNENKTENEIKHYMLYPMFDQEIELLEYLEKYYNSLNISLIPYSIREGYESLVEILKGWSEQIGKVAKSKSFLDKRNLIDEVVK